MPLKKHSRAVTLGVILGAISLIATGCTASSQTPESSATDGNASITAWLDAPRLAAGQAYVKAHPDQDIRIVTIDKSTVLSKISLANQAKSGWPDLVWPGDPATIGVLASKQINYAANIAKLVPTKIRDGFAKGALAGCEIAGGLYCMRNDLGQTVLWYDSVLMKQYGYSVPKTWDDYAALGKKVAADHPGTIIGTLAGKTGAGTYFVSSGCQTRDLVSATKVTINTSAKACTRVASMLQPLIENDTVLGVDYADPTVAKLGADGKILMMPGPTFFGDFAFRDAYKVPEGHIAAAVMPSWSGSKSVAGSAGGGILVVGRHGTAAQQKVATEMAVWMTTNVDLQKTLPTYPAYAPAAVEWCTVQGSAGYFSGDPCEAMKAMAPAVSPTFGSVTFQPQWETTYNSTIVSAAAKKGSLKDALSQWGQQLKSAAESEGYTVGTK